MPPGFRPLRPCLPRPWRNTASLAALCMLAACTGHYGSGPYHAGRLYTAPHHYYPPPGPPDDPWGPYIRDASHRVGVPERWIREVMRQESGGREQARSAAGAMGLMQLMPGTYESLQARYRLGNDPYEPHDNILAGAAYIREMYDRFGSPGFLAAYNAGPTRVDDYLAGTSSLPDETVNYLASVAPRLGGETPMTGPLAVYAANTGGAVQYAAAGGCDANAAYDPGRPCTPAPQPAAPVLVAAAAPMPASVAPPVVGGCDPDAAYDPDRPCVPTRSAFTAPLRVATAPTPYEPAVLTAPAVAAPPPAGGCDPDAAYDPNRPCAPVRPAPTPPLQVAAAPTPYEPAVVTTPAVAAPSPLGGCDPDAAYDPNRPCAPTRPAFTTPLRVAAAPAPNPIAAPVAFRPQAPLRPPPAPVAGGWAIQVGAFADPAKAREVADTIRWSLPGLRGARVELPPTARFGTTTLYRARLANLPAGTAADACARLAARQMACIIVRPGQDS